MPRVWSRRRWPSKYSPIPAELAAGLALNYWHQGADGIYLFNWFPHSYNNSEATGPYMSGLLKQLGDPDALRAKQRHLMFAADRGRPNKSYPHNWIHCILPAALPTEGNLGVSIHVGEDFRKASHTPSMTLRVAVDNLQEVDQVEATLNGKSVPGLKRTAAKLLTAPLKPDQVKQGRNQITLKLTEHSENSAKSRTVMALEIDVVSRENNGDR